MDGSGKTPIEAHSLVTINNHTKNRTHSVMCLATMAYV